LALTKNITSAKAVTLKKLKAFRRRLDFKYLKVFKLKLLLFDLHFFIGLPFAISLLLSENNDSEKERVFILLGFAGS